MIDAISYFILFQLQPEIRRMEPPHPAMPFPPLPPPPRWSSRPIPRPCPRPRNRSTSKRRRATIPRGKSLGWAWSGCWGGGYGDGTEGCTVGQINQESRLKYWATRSSVSSHRLLVCLLRNARYARALCCTHSFIRSLILLTPELVGP